MMFASISSLRHRSPSFLSPVFSSLTLRRRSLSIFAAQRSQNPKDVSRKFQQPSRNLLKAREMSKQLSTLAPILAADEKPQLSRNQAVGMVASSQANFMRVIIQSFPQGASGVDELSKSEGSGSFGDNSLDDSGGMGVELLCVVRAVLKKIKRRVLVGDKVLVGSIDWVDRRGMIENVFERKSETVDPPVANVDQLLVLFSMDQPKVEPFMLTRFLVEAESTGIPFILALNKCELVDEVTVFEWRSRLRSWGYKPVFCSVQSKEGIDSLQFQLRDSTSVIVGPSGVGKSSLINTLRGNKRLGASIPEDNWFEPILGSKWFEEQRVGEVSARSGRGKQTTRNVSLLRLPEGGYLADTPGFNQPSLMKVTKQSLAQHFPEIRKMLDENEHAQCSFKDCLHLGEPGCIIKGGWERYSYYFQLLDEIKIREEFQLRTLGTKREGDVRYKVGNSGKMQAEPRLELKKHRRKSRKSVNQSILDELDELDDDDGIVDVPILRAAGEENN